MAGLPHLVLRLAADRRLALATAVGMVARVHRRAAHRRAAAEPARAAGLAELDVLRARRCRPGRSSPCRRRAPGAPRRRAGGRWRSRLPWPSAAPRCRRCAPSGRRGPGFSSMLWIMRARSGCCAAAARCRRGSRPRGRPSPCRRPSGRPARGCSASRHRAYWSSAIRAERFGSYSIAATRPGTPSLLRFKSMMRYMRLWPPPRWRTVMRPWLLRPACFLSGSVSDFSGLLFVISSNVETVMPRRPGEVGLVYCVVASVTPSCLYTPWNSSIRWPALERDDRLLPVRSSCDGVPRPAAHLARATFMMFTARDLDVRKTSSTARLDLDLVRRRGAPRRRTCPSSLRIGVLLRDHGACRSTSAGR